MTHFIVKKSQGQEDKMQFAAIYENFAKSSRWHTVCGVFFAGLERQGVWNIFFGGTMATRPPRVEKYILHTL